MLTIPNDVMNLPRYSNYRLLVMTKSPQPGRVKTRMQPDLTPQQSCELHLALIGNTVAPWRRNNVCPVNLWIEGPSSLLFEAVPELSGMTCFSQVEGDLGDKMHWAAATTLTEENIDGVILLGTDCPFVDSDYIESALDYLETGGDAVIGPAADGGYVLLGIKKADRSLFEHINWGSHSVLSKTIERLNALAWKYRQLPVLHDIDRYDDLALLDSPNLTCALRKFSHG